MLVCPAKHFVNITGSVQENLCLNFCPTGTFDNGNKFCIPASQCPANHFGNPNSQSCVAMCPLVSGIQTYGDSILRICVENCPPGYYSQSGTNLCVD